MCIPGPPNDCIFLVISHMTIFFGHTAYMPKFRILSCTHAGVIMTSIFPICFQYVFNNLSIFSIFFILSNLATFQYAFNMFPIFINILQTCHLSPNTAKYGHMTKKNCHSPNSAVFGQITAKMVIRCSRYVYMWELIKIPLSRNGPFFANKYYIYIYIYSRAPYFRGAAEPTLGNNASYEDSFVTCLAKLFLDGLVTCS